MERAPPPSPAAAALAALDEILMDTPPSPKRQATAPGKPIQLGGHQSHDTVDLGGGDGGGDAGNKRSARGTVGAGIGIGLHGSGQEGREPREQREGGSATRSRLASRGREGCTPRIPVLFLVLCIVFFSFSFSI